jgi:hypothetical protein
MGAITDAWGTSDEDRGVRFQKQRQAAVMVEQSQEKTLVEAQRGTDLLHQN